MNRVFKSTLLAFLVGLAISCGVIGGSALTEKAALDMIRKSEGYPMLTVIYLWNVPKDSPIGRKIAEMIKDGYLLSGPLQSSAAGGIMGNHLPITEKGKNLVLACTWYEVKLGSIFGHGGGTFGQTYNFAPFTHEMDIAVKKILTDKKRGTAEVTYVVNLKPTPFFHELYKIDKNALDRTSVKLRFREDMRVRDASQPVVAGERKAFFRKYDQGWQIVDEADLFLEQLGAQLGNSGR